MAGALTVILLFVLAVLAGLALHSLWRIEDAVRLEILRMRGVDQAILDELRPTRRGLGPEEGF